MRIKLALAGGAIGALGLLAAAPAAFASDNSNAGLHAGVSQCSGSGATQGTDAGFQNVHQDGTTVNLNYHLKGAAADATFSIFGYDSFCHFDTFLGTVTTNDNGVGNALFSYTVPAGATTVWTYGYNLPFTQTVESEATPLG